MCLAIGWNLVVLMDEPPEREREVPPAATGALLTFDVVRIAPSGDVVLAGRAAPGALVVIQNAGEAIGEARSDAHGSWVFVPETPLPPGPRQLSATVVIDGALAASVEGPPATIAPQIADPNPPAPSADAQR